MKVSIYVSQESINAKRYFICFFFSSKRFPQHYKELLYRYTSYAHDN